MNKHTVVVCDHIHHSGLEILKDADDINYVYAADVNKDDLLEIIENADVCITRSSTDIDKKFLSASKELKAIIRAGVGVDNVDIKGCSKLGIIVMNIPTANTIAATELTIAHMLSCIRKIPYAHNQLKNDKIWKREDWYGQELYGKKLGVIGFGNIGHRVALRAKAFEMDVITYDPYIDSSKATNLDVKYTYDFNDILQCDVITIHTPKNEETINMINEKEIKKMKDGVILINCARGGLYNEDALCKYLNNGKILMAGIDVFKKEPAVSNPLLDLPNVIVTAHLGANTVESQYKISTQVATNAINAARGVCYKHALNLPVTDQNMPKFVEPYLELTQKISFLISQMNKTAIKSIKLIAEGEIGDYLDSFTTFATVGALMTACSNEKINYVNAKFIAQEKAIIIDSKIIPNTSGYSNKITVKISTQNNTNSISGTIFNENVQRIIEIDEYNMDIEPSGNMLLIKNSDEPGVIGEFGRILGDEDINISDFRLGRNNHSALAVILVDDEVNENVIEKLRNIKATESVNFIKI